MEMSGCVPAKAFLLAAGLGTRLKPLTDATPKCLLQIGGRPILHWWLAICERVGVREVLINTHHHADQVRDFVRSSAPSALTVKLTYEPFLLGSAGTLAANRDFVAKEKDFWIFYADTLIGADLAPVAVLHRSRGASLTLGLFKSDDPKSGGVVELSAEGRILSFEEKPSRPKSDLVAAGASIAGSSLLDALPPSVGDLAHDVFPQLMGNAYGVALNPVIDIGTPANYAYAKKEWFRFGF